MIVTCPNCTTRLQLDAAKVPARAFSVRCPKCQQIINAQPSAGATAQRDALSAVGDLPATTRAQKETNGGAPASVLREEAAGAAAQGSAAPAAESEVLRLLASLLQGGGAAAPGAKSAGRRPTWERRRALLCMGSVNCEPVANKLLENNYDVIVVGEAAQAVEQMREDKVDVVMLDQEFDTPARGALVINRELSSMRMPDRRRVVFVQLSSSTRTGDAHAAFLSGCNFVFNPSDLQNLPRLLDKNIRDLNDLYRDFNKALSQPDI